MFNMTIIGKMGTGKTHFVKKLIAGKRQFIFDVNNDYKDLVTNYNAPKSRMVDLDHEVFIDTCLKKKNTICVFEDATGFLEGRLPKKFRKAFVAKRHTGNANIYLFHDIKSAPPKMISLSDFVVLFYTSDELYQVQKKYPSLLKSFIEVQDMYVKNPHYYKIIKI